MTDQQFADWLRDSDRAHMVALYNFTVDIDGVVSTLKLSRMKYDGAPYQACIDHGLIINQRISPDGAARMSAGQIRIGNLDGKRNAWARYVWLDVEVLIGDLRWPLADFRPWFRGDVEDCNFNEDGTELVVTILDKMKQLDVPVSEVKFADGTHCPVALGECVNVSPKYNAATESWVYHTGPAAGLVGGEGRVEGRPRTTVTQTLATGSFKFLTNEKNIGTITASVFGDATGGTYRNTIASLVRLVIGDDTQVDTAKFDAFDSAHPQPVGLYMPEREMKGPAIAKLASSVQAQLLPSLLGKFQLVQWGASGAPTATIGPKDYVQPDNGAAVKFGTPIPPAPVVTIAYCRNYTPQTPQASLPEAHKALFAAPWRTATARRAAARDRFRLPDSAPQIETCFTAQANAQDEAERRADLGTDKRIPHTVDCYPAALLHTIGQTVTLTGYGNGQITMLEPNFDTFNVQVEVTI